MLTMKDITTTSLLSVALALVTSTASSACVNPGSIGSKEECVRFCQVDEISYGGGICQCLGKSLGGLWSPFGECTCPGGGDCLPEGSDEPPQSTTTSTASPQTDPRPNDSGKDPNAKSAPVLDGFTFVGMGKCVNKDGRDYIQKFGSKENDSTTATIQDCAEYCGSEADGVNNVTNYAISMVGFEYGCKIAYETYSEYACWCLSDLTSRYSSDRPLGPIVKVETIDNNGVEPYCYRYDAYSPVTLAPTQQPSDFNSGQSSDMSCLGMIKVGLFVASILMVV